MAASPLAHRCIASGLACRDVQGVWGVTAVPDDEFVSGAILGIQGCPPFRTNLEPGPGRSATQPPRVSNTPSPLLALTMEMLG